MKQKMKLFCYFLQWYVIVFFIVGDYEGIKVKLENVNIMKKYFEVRYNIDSIIKFSIC